MSKRTLLKYSSGREPSQLVFKNCNLINVFTGEIYTTDIAIQDGIIVGIGEYNGIKEKDLKGKYVCPGLLDGHIHIESGMVSPFQLNRALMPHGTTTIIADPHEIANVCGEEGIRYLLEAGSKIPMDIFLMAPSCVPATPSEYNGATLDSEDIKPLYNYQSILGLGEVMNFPGVLNGEDDIWNKIDYAHSLNRVVDGHAPGVTGKDLVSYVLAGITSDHECTTVKEAIERLRLGQWVMVREGTASKNLDDLYPLITVGKSRRIILVTDDKHPENLFETGHMDYIIRKLIMKGINPVTAIQMATINTAEYFRLYDRGAIAPGYRADLVVLDNLESFSIEEVYKDGQLVVSRENGLMITGSECDSTKVQQSFSMPKLKESDICLCGSGKMVRVIGIVPNQIITRELFFEIENEDGVLEPDLDLDIVKVVVAERHKNTGKVYAALVHGFGLKSGAIASSIAHDSHNLIIIGTNDRDICLAGNQVRTSQGGICIAENGKIRSQIILPIAGLMTNDNLENLNNMLKIMKMTAHEMGVYPTVDPFMTLSFLALPVIPELKITPNGIINVTTQSYQTLIVESS